MDNEFSSQDGNITSVKKVMAPIQISVLMEDNELL